MGVKTRWGHTVQMMSRAYGVNRDIILTHLVDRALTELENPTSFDYRFPPAEQDFSPFISESARMYAFVKNTRMHRAVLIQRRREYGVPDKILALGILRDMLQSGMLVETKNMVVMRGVKHA